MAPKRPARWHWHIDGARTTVCGAGLFDVAWTQIEEHRHLVSCRECKAWLRKRDAVERPSHAVPEAEGVPLP